MAKSKLVELKDRLSELVSRREAEMEKQSVLRNLEAEIDETASELATLEAADLERKTEAAIAKLRKAEAAQLGKIVDTVEALESQLAEFEQTRHELESLRRGSSNRGVILDTLHQTVLLQWEHWRKRYPTVLGLPPLPTRGELRVIDAKVQLEQAERRLEKAEQAREEAHRPTVAHKKLIDDAKRAIKHQRSVIKWAEKNKDERRPTEPRPLPEMDPSERVTPSFAD